jgi:hypothetical protein
MGESTDESLFAGCVPHAYKFINLCCTFAEIIESASNTADGETHSEVGEDAAGAWLAMISYSLLTHILYILSKL